MSLEITTDHLDSVLKSIRQLTRKEVLVGMPAGARERQEAGEPVNAMLGYLHETGSPAHNLPARPFLVPGVRSAQKKVNACLKQGALAALDRDTKGTETALHRAGLAAQNAVRAKISTGPFEPLAESTLRARARRGRKGAATELDRRKKGHAPNHANARPLIDTGQLRKAVTYVVRKASK